MFQHKMAVTALAALSVIPFVVGQPAASNQLPPGTIEAKASTACTECHETRIIVQQRLSKAAWTKEVDKMIKWGALVDPQDHDALVDYLSANFGVDKPEDVADRSRSRAATMTKK
jgi:hypothetical protein